MTALISLEPPNGDFVAYIDAIVGPPPEDPETAARQISEQLALRSKDNIAIMNAISPSHNQDGRHSANAAFVNRGPLTTSGAGLGAAAQRALRVTADGQLDGLPDIAASLQQGASGMRGLIGSVSRLLMIGGGVWLFAAIALTKEFPWLSPVPGIALVFIGIVMNNASSPKTRPRT